MKNYFDVLGLEKNASISEVKKAYRRLSMDLHPDRNKNVDVEKFYSISEAYKILSNPKKRTVYLNNQKKSVANKPKEYVESLWDNLLRR
jgi:curved DNA-binding protein CbpA